VGSGEASYHGRYVAADRDGICKVFDRLIDRRDLMFDAFACGVSVLRVKFLRHARHDLVDEVRRQTVTMRCPGCGERWSASSPGTKPH
jgi:hypothetical protein